MIKLNSRALLQFIVRRMSTNKKKNQDPSLPAEYYRMRQEMVQSRKAAGENPFPHKFDVGISLANFIEKYDSILTERGKVLEDDTVRVAGFYFYFVGQC